MKTASRQDAKSAKIKNGQRAKPLLWILLSILWLGVVVACQSPTVAGQPPPNSPAAVESASATPHIIPTLQPPVVVTDSSASTESEMPSFSLATAPAGEPPSSPAGEAIATLPLAPPTTPAAEQTAAGQISATAYPAPTSSTVEPTFTPPPPPIPVAEDHFWLGRPVPEGGVVWTDKTYPYGSTRGGTLRPHHGVEFNVQLGTPVFTAAPGTVVVAGDDLTIAYGAHTNFYGNLVIIQHDFLYNGQPVYTLYGHLSQVLVSVGQVVGTAEQIALSGGSGVADGPHLHFEVRVGQNDYANTRNPLLWLNPFPGRGVVAGRVLFASGNPANEAPVSLRRIDGSAPYNATTTYAQEQLNPDDGWQENFALDDVVAGYYEVSVRNGEETLEAEVWVYPNQTSFVEIMLP